MKIAIPINGKKSEELAEHFGRCPAYAVLNEKGELTGTIDNTSEHAGGTGLPPELLKKQGITILICKGIGPKAINACKEDGITVYTTTAQTINQAFKEWENNELKSATPCK